MPDALIPILTSVGGSFAKQLVGGMFGGGGGGGKEKAQHAQMQQQAPAAAKALFQPDQIAKFTDQYAQQGNAKWNQINAGMGAGGGTGGPALAPQIATQAEQMAATLGGLTDQSGYGASTDIAGLAKQLEPNIGAKYSVYG